MSKHAVHSVSSHRSSTASHTSHTSHASSATTHAAKKTEAVKDGTAAQHGGGSDAFKISDEANDLRKPAQADAAKPTDATKPTDETKPQDPSKPDDAQSPDEAKDPSAEDPSAEDPNAEKTDKEKQIDELKKMLEELQKLQEEKDKMKDKQPPEDLGGCCGKSHGSKKAGDDQGKQDPNSVLLADVAAVKLERAGGAAKGQQQGKNGQGQNGQGGDGSAIGKLQTDYETFKQQGAQIRPEVEQQVQACLSGGGAATQGFGQGAGQGTQGQGTHPAAGATPPVAKK